MEGLLAGEGDEGAGDLVEGAPEGGGFGDEAGVAAELDGDGDADVGDEEGDGGEQGVQRFGRRIGAQAWLGGGGRARHDWIPSVAFEPAQGIFSEECDYGR